MKSLITTYIYMYIYIYMPLLITDHYSECVHTNVCSLLDVCVGYFVSTVEEEKNQRLK